MEIVNQRSKAKSTRIVQLLWSFPLSKPTWTFLLVSVLCCVMCTIRFIRLDSLRYGFLIWNLFLAWVPLFFAVILQAKEYPKGFLFMSKDIIKTQEKVLFISLLGLWLLFFPNAPYLISDLMHLKFNKDPIIWFDAVLMFAFALTGLQVGLLSLFMVQQVLGQAFGKIRAWAMLMLIIWLTGFGVYMGRELRFNSWDIFTHPLQLVEEVIAATSIHGINMGILYSTLIGAVYLAFRSLLTTKVN